MMSPNGTLESAKGASGLGMSTRALINDSRKVLLSFGKADSQIPGDDDDDDGRAAETALLCSRFLSAWGQRMWEFSKGLILLDLHPNSLALVALLGLVDSLAQMLAGPYLGAYIDRTPRLVAAVRMYRLQNAAVALSAFSACTASFLAREGFMYWFCILATIFIGSVSTVGCQGTSLSVDREWTKALCHGDSAALASLNAGMRRIDLISVIASPMMAGLLMTLGSKRVAVVGILIWSLLAWWPECRLLRLAQQSSPHLRQQELAPESEEDPRLTLEALRRSAAESREAWRVYRSQAVFPAGLALALLYLTVMHFGLLMTAYLNLRGMLETTLSLYSAGAALAGIGATLCWSTIHARLGLEGAGLVGLLCQWGPLVATLILSSVLAQPAGGHVLSAGLVSSRFGLWTFDLAVGQMLQERVPNEQLGVVNGMQSSLQSLLQALSYAVGLVVWQPQLFVFLMAGSVLVVTAALAVYLYFIGAKEWLEEQISTQRQYQPMQATAQTEQACELTWQTDLPEKK